MATNREFLRIHSLAKREGSALSFLLGTAKIVDFRDFLLLSFLCLLFFALTPRVILCCLVI